MAQFISDSFKVEPGQCRDQPNFPWILFANSLVESAITGAYKSDNFLVIKIFNVCFSDCVGCPAIRALGCQIVRIFWKIKVFHACSFLFGLMLSWTNFATKLTISVY